MLVPLVIQGLMVQLAHRVTQVPQELVDQVLCAQTFATTGVYQQSLKAITAFAESAIESDENSQVVVSQCLTFLARCGLVW